MDTYPHPDAIIAGIAHLDATYPRWWDKVNPSRLDMNSFTQHLLAQIHGLLVYETPEFTFHNWAWMCEHGFAPYGGAENYALLTVEWIFQTRLAKEQRK